MNWQESEAWGIIEGPTMEPIQSNSLGTFPMTTMVYIDDVKGHEVHGEFENVFDRLNSEFHELTQFLLELDAALDEIKYPQAFMRRRTWPEEKLCCGISPEQEPRQWSSPTNQNRGLPNIQRQNRRRGRVTSFCIQVITRRNASWQGRIIWLPNKGECREAHFRSVLELLGLIQLALQQVCETGAAG